MLQRIKNRRRIFNRKVEKVKEEKKARGAKFPGKNG
jgi:hypothetical protein